MAFTPYDGTEATVGYPFILIQTERPYSSAAPVNLGYVKSVDIAGGIETGGIEAANSISLIREYIDKHELTITAELMQIEDVDLRNLIFNPSGSYSGTTPPAISANVDMREVQCQVILPDMADMTDLSSITIADGLWVPRASLIFHYDRTLDGKTPITIKITLKALAQDEDWTDATLGTIVSAGDLWLDLTGKTADLSPTGTGFSINGWDSALT